MKRKTLIVILAIVLLLCCFLLVLVAGLILYMSGNSFGGTSKLEPLMINANDLPSGWESAEHYFSLPYHEGTLAVRNDVFQYSGLYLSHEIYLYPSDDAAATGYEITHDSVIVSPLPAKPVDITFTPRNSADKFDKFCTDGTSPRSYYCIFIQSHRKYVIELRTVFDNKVLTAAQVNEILRRLDSKLP